MQDGVRAFLDGCSQEGAYDRLTREVQELIMENACEFKVETPSSDFSTPFNARTQEGSQHPRCC